MLGHRGEELIDLLGFRFALSWLEVEFLPDDRVTIDSVAASLPVEGKTEVLNDADKVVELDVSPVALQEPPQEFAAVHVRATPATSSMRFLGRFFSMRTAQTLYSGIRDSSS